MGETHSRGILIEVFGAIVRQSHDDTDWRRRCWHGHDKKKASAHASRIRRIRRNSSSAPSSHGIWRAQKNSDVAEVAWSRTSMSSPAPSFDCADDISILITELSADPDREQTVSEIGGASVLKSVVRLSNLSLSGVL